MQLGTLITCLLLLLWPAVAPPEVLSVDSGFDLTWAGVVFYVDPVFLIWGEGESIPPCNAFTGYSVIVVDERFRQPERKENFEYLLAWEKVRIEQFSALGLLEFPLHRALDARTREAEEVNWSDPTQPRRLLWIPPERWINTYHFLWIRVL